MKKALSLAALASIVLLAGFARAPGAGAAVPSYTGCLSPILNAIYDVAPGDAPAHGCVRPAAVIRLSSGDVTSLAAGAGLTGGGDNGDVSMSIAPSFRLPQACTNGQTAAWNGTAWGCASGASQADFNALVALLGSPGTINDASNPVHWTKLKGVPAGFADGTDDVGPSYAAGAGLNLGGTTFSVDPAQVQNRIADSCPIGSSIRAIAQNGAVTCQGHSSYTAGEGLALSSNQFSVADGGVTPAKLTFDPATQTELDGLVQLLSTPGTINDAGNPVDWSKLLSVPAGFADGTDDTGLTSVTTGTGLGGSGTGGDPLQLGSTYRLPQSCSSGQVPKWNGTLWSCGSDDQGGGAGGMGHSPAANDLSTIDSAGLVGRFSSITVGADGLGLISYIDFGYNILKVAHCADAACTSAAASELDSPVSQYSSVTIGADGLGLVSYYKNSHLKVAHCDNTTCTSATSSTLDSAGDVGKYSSLTVGADGLGLISYYDNTNGALKAAHCANTACTSAMVSRLDGAGFLDVGQYSSVTVGADGLGLVSYYDGTNRDLKVAHCVNVACTSATASTLDSSSFLDLGQYSTLTVGADGLGLISYLDDTNSDLKVAHCVNVACTSATASTLDGGGDVGFYSSVTVGADGLGLVSYYDDTNSDLKVAHCVNVACASATTSTLDNTGLVGAYSSLTVGADGLGLVSYLDATHGGLKVAHLSSSFGVPYFRRR